MHTKSGRQYTQAQWAKRLGGYESLAHELVEYHPLEARRVLRESTLTEIATAWRYKMAGTYGYGYKRTDD